MFVSLIARCSIVYSEHYASFIFALPLLSLSRMCRVRGQRLTLEGAES